MEVQNTRKKTPWPGFAEVIDASFCKIQPAGIMEICPAEIVLAIGTRKEMIS